MRRAIAAWSTAAVAAVSFSLLIPLSTAQATPPADRPGWCQSQGDLRAREMPDRVRRADCDLRGRFVRGDDVAVAVPAPDVTLKGSALKTTGSETVEVRAAADGSSWEITHRAAPERATGTGNVVFNPDTGPQGNACSDVTFIDQGWRTPSNQSWYFNPQYQPSYISGSTQDEIARGFARMSQGINDCGYGARTAAYAYYQTTTATRPNISGDMLRCYSADSMSIAAWGSSAISTLALNCTSKNTSNSLVYSSDTQFNAHHVWDDVVSSGCRVLNGKYAYDIEAVATHEWGHTVGLDDLYSGSNSEQTMYGYTNPCDARQRTLGLGDRTFMVNAYGYR